MKKTLAALMEWLRPGGIVLVYVLADRLPDPVAKFHVLGPFMVMVMSGTVAFESLVLGEAASGKIGYAPDRHYQVQSGLNNLATALTALLVYVLDWGRYADAAVTTAMLLFFALSGANHAVSAIRERNFKPANLLRPVMILFLVGLLIPPMLRALAR